MNLILALKELRAQSFEERLLAIQWDGDLDLDTGVLGGPGYPAVPGPQTLTEKFSVVMEGFLNNSDVTGIVLTFVLQP